MNNQSCQHTIQTPYKSEFLIGQSQSFEWEALDAFFFPFASCAAATTAASSLMAENREAQFGRSDLQLHRGNVIPLVVGGGISGGYKQGNLA